jgi:hypothetical protein
MSWLFTAGMAIATPSEADLTKSIVTLQLYRGGEIVREGSGFVVQGDRFNGYIVTNAQLIAGIESLAVSVPGQGGQLVAQVLRTDSSSDYALLKANGLDLPALSFASSEPMSGEVVWSAAKLKGSEKLTLAKGLLRTSFKLSDENTGWYQHTAGLSANEGAVLLNDCGHVLGLNFTQPAGDGSIRALDMETLRRLLGQQNVKIAVADKVCVSEVMKAQEKAELASVEAKNAKNEAKKAQQVAKNLERQLNASKRSSDSLVQQTQLAQEQAQAATRAAEQAQAKAENTRLELEEKTSVLRDESQALLKVFEADRLKAEERFHDLLESQQQAAESRERILIGFAGALIVLIVIVLFLFLARSRNGVGPSRRRAGVGKGDSTVGETQMYREELSEYVLDGRDDDGIRYLLRISGDQLVDQAGVIIGRNPKDSPYIINHADVSRKHARIKVKNHRVFIEDLGSTNGTSVNGQSIDDKGLVSVSSGDQIIIGSVVMKLRVMEG